MAESKLLEQDKDEWIYHSMNKYSNLYMFELEYPLDALEIINETSLCVAGIQEYSKKCELLQLCVPPKLLRPENEEGLCKDRDFKILSGGYADGRVRQIKFLRQTSNLIAACQDGHKGVVIYEVGDDNRATILERQRLSAGELSKIPSALYCMKNRILLGVQANGKELETSDNGDAQTCVKLYEWAIDTTSLNVPVKTHSIWKTNPSNLKLGHIRKMKEWDENTLAFLTSFGTIALYDLRTDTETPEIVFHATKSLNNSSSEPISPPIPIIFSFDAIPEKNKIGVIDSCGGYEVFDPRYTGSEASTSTKEKTTRSLLPDFGSLAGVYPDWFNIEYENGTKMREMDSCRFIISGVKKECVPVYEEKLVISEDKQNVDNESSEKQFQLTSVFSHDGHSKPVSHSMWHPHPLSDNLIFSASLDAVLHAWQFIPGEQEQNN